MNDFTARDLIILANALSSTIDAIGADERSEHGVLFEELLRELERRGEPDLDMKVVIPEW